MDVYSLEPLVKDWIKRECVSYGDFNLASGKSSNVFIDIEKIAYRPIFQRWWAKKLTEFGLTSQSNLFNYAGPPCGAIPLIYAGHYDNYGIHPIISYWDTWGIKPKYVIVDDVVTTGKSIREFMAQEKINKRQVLAVCCVVDRGEHNLHEKFVFKSAFTLDDIL